MGESARLDERQELFDAFIADQASLLVIARRIVRSGSDAEDVVQDVAMKLCRVSGDRNVQCPISYLRGMVRNQAIDRLRRAAQNACEATTDVDVETLMSGEQGPEGRIENREALRAVAAALAALPERTRRVFVAHRLAGEPQNVIAACLGVSPTLVNFMVRDATLACRRALGANGAAPDSDSSPAPATVRASARNGTGGLREAG